MQFSESFIHSSIPRIQVPTNKTRSEVAQARGANDSRLASSDQGEKHTHVQKQFTSTWARTQRSYGLSNSIFEEVYLRPSCQYLSRRRLQSMKPKEHLWSFLGANTHSCNHLMYYEKASALQHLKMRHPSSIGSENHNAWKFVESNPIADLAGFLRLEIDPHF